MPRSPLLLVSACLLGQSVRYDGGHKLCPRLAALRQARWIPVCPEVLAGFGIPRPPMRLLRKGDATIVTRLADGLDVTGQLRDACLRITRDVLARGIRGAVVKSRSPSCAMYGASFSPEQGGDPGAEGVLVRTLREFAPDLPVIDEAAFEDAGRRAAFCRKLGM